MTEGVRITGLRETVRSLERLGVSAQDLKDAFGQISQDVAQEARQIVPVREGRLQASIRPARTKNKAVIRAGSKSRTPYAAVINYGWPAHGIAATGFLTTPANSNIQDRLRHINAELEALIRKYDLN